MREKKKIGKKMKIALGIAAGLALAGILVMGRRPSADAAGQGGQETQEVAVRSLVRSVGATGTVISVETKEITSVLTGMKVEEIAVEVGDTVAEGDVLITFDMEDVEENLTDAKEQLSTSQQQNAITAENAQRNVDDAKRTESYQTTQAAISKDSAYQSYVDAQNTYNTAVSNLDELKEDEEAAASAYESAKSALQAATEKLEAAAVAMKNSETGSAAAQSALTEAEKALGVAETVSTNAAIELATHQVGCDASQADQSAQDSTEVETVAAETAEAETSSDTTETSEKECETCQKLEAKAEAAAAALTEAQSAYNEKASAYTAASSAAAAYEQAKAAYEQASAAVSSAQSAYNTLAASREAQESSVDSLASSVNNALNNYNSQSSTYDNTVASQASSVAGAVNSQKSSALSANTDNEEKQVEQYQEQLEEGTVVSPISGIVTAVNVDPGDTYGQGALLTIQDCSSFEVKAEIGEYDISDIELGQRVLIKTEATREEELEGTVIFISPTASPGTGSGVTYEVRIFVDTPNDRLRLDMSASLSILIEQHEQALTVPYNAVQTDVDGNTFVEVLEGETVTQVFVTVLMESNYYTEISAEGLEEGQQVIVVSESEGMNITLPIDVMRERGVF